MNHFRACSPVVGIAVVIAAGLSCSCPAAEPIAGLPPLQFPQIAHYGSVVALPDAGERIRAGGWIAIGVYSPDVTAAT